VRRRDPQRPVAARHFAAYIGIQYPPSARAPGRGRAKGHPRPRATDVVGLDPRTTRHPARTRQTITRLEHFPPIATISPGAEPRGPRIKSEDDLPRGRKRTGRSRCRRRAPSGPFGPYRSRGIAEGVPALRRDPAGHATRRSHRATPHAGPPQGNATRAVAGQRLAPEPGRPCNAPQPEGNAPRAVAASAGPRWPAGPRRGGRGAMALRTSITSRCMLP